MKHYKNVKLADFKKVKALLAEGIPKKYIYGITGRSSSTIWMIERSADFDEYKARLYERNHKITLSRQAERAASAMVEEAMTHDIPAYRC
jgi:hypothetical protein